MKTKKNQIFAEIIKNLELININDYESYKNEIVLKFPKNYKTNKPYQGQNAFNLLLHNIVKNYDLEYFLTVPQLLEYGTPDFKGQKLTKIKFYTNFYQNKINYKDKIKIIDYEKLDQEEQKKYEFKTIVNHSNVLNLQQLNNLEEMNFDFNINQSKKDLSINDELLNNLNDNKGLELYYTKTDTAKYSLVKDRIVLPLYEDFKNDFHFHSTLFHELIHWTGSANRLNRFDIKRTENFDYDLEELIAEIGAILLMIHFQISDNIYNSIAYIKIYLSNFGEEERINQLEKAFAESQKAVNFLLE